MGSRVRGERMTEAGMRQALPAWWTDEDTAAWERVKRALHRDWLQTKFALTSASSRELTGEPGRTATDLAGASPADASGFAEHEAAIRYGFGAAGHYDHDDWNEQLEAKLRREWSMLDTIAWQTVRPFVRYGWAAARITHRR